MLPFRLLLLILLLLLRRYHRRLSPSWIFHPSVVAWRPFCFLSQSVRRELLFADWLMQRWGRACSVTIISRPWATKVKRIFPTFPVYGNVGNFYFIWPFFSPYFQCCCRRDLDSWNQPCCWWKYLKFVLKMCFCHFAKILSRHLTRTLSPVAFGIGASLSRSVRRSQGKWCKDVAHLTIIIKREARKVFWRKHQKRFNFVMMCCSLDFPGRRARQWKARLGGSILLHIYLRWEPE